MKNFEDLLCYIRENDIDGFNSLADKIYLDSGDKSKAIVQAIRTGNFEMFKLVYSKLRIDEGSEAADEAMYEAAKKGDIDIVKFLHSKGFDLNNTKLWEGYTAIHSAALSGNFELIKWLIDNGSDIKLVTKRGTNLLNLASYSNFTELMQLLLAQGFDANFQELEGVYADGFSPLHCAAGHIEAAALLCEHGANIEIKDKNGLTPIYFAGICGQLKMIDWLYEKGAKIDFATNDGLTFLHIAAQNGHLKLIESLIEQKFDVNATTIKESKTPLRIAAQHNQFEAVKLLVKHGANLNLPDHEGRTPVYWAACCNNQAMVECLYENGADIFGKYEKIEESLLHVAAENNNTQLIELLISKGVDPNIRTKNEYFDFYRSETGIFYETPMHRAADCRAFEAAKLLFSYGAELDIQDGGSNTSMYNASYRNDLDLVKWLYENGCSIDTLGCEGRPIHRAARGNSYDVVKWLIEKGADINEKQEWGTPLDICLESQNSDVAMLLLSHKVAININDIGSFILDTFKFLNESKNIKDNIRGGLYLVNTFKKFLSEDHDPSDYGGIFNYPWRNFVNYYQKYIHSEIIEKFIQELLDELVEIIKESNLDAIEVNLTEKNVIEILTLQGEWIEIAQENKENEKLHDSLVSNVIDELEKPKLKLLQQTLQVEPPHKLTQIAKDDMLQTLVSFLSHPDQMSLAKAYQEDTQPQTKKPKINAPDNFENTLQIPLETSASGELNENIDQL
ncbi:hypothetical protein phytr_440 [Candidatus Phycorickettsia trachydisci]|uniref:Uncharacterized protein n=1 Tax=Candidatus Phycorickettsia trachydisci TaxID=2115978 RepID=A0A2P1P6X8_9RICK|nr:ankyrin repeat domain-containing protein [Candidatus Phycorickettsia trachydisci]AVP87007.1 hypothetical protein phytr_440 [Candidatus Phycorickettsia trachydisci]